ncbi:hypothetical protein FEP65_04092 [Burkholderia multivorans]|nr:hypothetical protein [Burkholderia multivorans]
MRGVDIVPRDVQPHVMDLQREDRQPVDDRAGRFAVEPRIRVRGRQRGEQHLVERLDRVVALLVQPIDRALVLDDRAIGHVAAPRFVLVAPQRRIAVVIAMDLPPRGTDVVDGRTAVVVDAREQRRIVEVRDVGGMDRLHRPLLDRFGHVALARGHVVSRRR